MNRHEQDFHRQRSHDRPRDDQGRFQPEQDRQGWRENRQDNDQYYGSGSDNQRWDSNQSNYNNGGQDRWSNSNEYGHNDDSRSAQGGHGWADDRSGNSRADWNSSNVGGYAQNLNQRGSRNDFNQMGGSTAGGSYRTESLRSNLGLLGNGQQQQQQGSHIGKGPKGYRRSDDRILEDVNETLAQHSEIDASEIEVKVSSGEVTLTGTVNDRQSKRLAEDVVERCSGVLDVRNEIRVQREADNQNQGQQAKGKSNGRSDQKTM